MNERGQRGPSRRQRGGGNWRGGKRGIPGSAERGGAAGRARARRARGPRSTGQGPGQRPGAATTLGPALTCGCGSGRAAPDRALRRLPSRAPTPAPRGARGGEGAGAGPPAANKGVPSPPVAPAPSCLGLPHLAASPVLRLPLAPRVPYLPAGAWRQALMGDGLGVGGPAAPGGPGRIAKPERPTLLSPAAQSCHSGAGVVRGREELGRARVHL